MDVQLISVLTWPCSGEASQSRTDTGRVSVTRACSAATTTTVTVRWPGLCEALGIRTPRRGVAAFSSAHESSDETFLTCSVEVPVMGRCSRPHAVTQLHNRGAMQPPKVRCPRSPCYTEQCSAPGWGSRKSKQDIGCGEFNISGVSHLWL